MLISINQFVNIASLTPFFGAVSGVFYRKNGLDAEHVVVFLASGDAVMVTGSVPTEASVLAVFPGAVDLGNSFITGLSSL